MSGLYEPIAVSLAWRLKGPDFLVKVPQSVRDCFTYSIIAPATEKSRLLVYDSSAVTVK